MDWTWWNGVGDDMKRFGLSREDAQSWRKMEKEN